MKVTDNEIIRNGEQDLIDGITADLDWSAIEEVFRENHKLTLGEDVSYKSGDIVVHNNQIAYSLEFEIKVPISIILDRQGNCVDIQSVAVADEQEGSSVTVDSEENPAPQGRGSFGEVDSLDEEADDQELADIFTNNDGDTGEDSSLSGQPEDSVGDSISQSAIQAQIALAADGENT
jgi:hypothetical protein